jgi:hypothetical protein
MSTTIITPDNLVSTSSRTPHLFLAGSIEQGKATDWQAEAIEFFSAKMVGGELTVVNPRRASWNPDLEQSIDNPEFNHQVTFELHNLDKADGVVMWLEPGTMSPISLLELGLLAGWTNAGQLNKLVVGCPPGFWRKGNVDIVCARYGIQVVSTFQEMLDEGYTVLMRNHQRRAGFEDTISIGRYD